ncbi:MAG TPA: MBOAT family O-acyltransferase [Flavobacteriales bacterium]|nr:MBOAT family O-acyltransferase [Flavobacteriales bacterium]
MLFNSLAFAFFLPVVFALYWWVFRERRLQNGFLLLASWAFYAWWDWRFLGLLLFSTITDYLIGQRLHTCDEGRKRKAWLTLSIGINIGLLCAFKYLGFFVESAADLLRSMGMDPHVPVLRIALPVGISFYTFQTLSYTIDIYRKQYTPTRDPIAFAAFVAFFPQLVAGPIERARDLLPQFEDRRTFEPQLAADGLRQMLWGFFKKLAVADPLGNLADRVFSMDPHSTGGVMLFLGALCFAFQIYGDFSGYSDIAIGCARLFGFRLSRNFNYPYFSRSIGEFWRRWHMSLSGWLRDYVYMPLGGARTKAGRLRNILITFGVSGLWHGANWTFIGWGLLHGAYYTPEVLAKRRERQRSEPTWRDIPRMMTVFLAVLAAWVVFRAPSLEVAASHLYHIAANATLRKHELLDWLQWGIWWPTLLMLAAEWRSRRDQHGLARMSRHRAVRWAIYLFLVIAIGLRVQPFIEHAFIYFRF